MFISMSPTQQLNNAFQIMCAELGVFITAFNFLSYHLHITLLFTEHFEAHCNLMHIITLHTVNKKGN